MRSLLWLCALCVTACVHTSSRVESSSRGAPSSSAGPGAASYSSEPTPGLLTGEASDPALTRALADACAEQRLTADGRLAELARAVALATQGGAPSAALVSYHAQRLGLPDPTPQLWLANASSSGAVLAALTAAVRRAGALEPLTHCGGAAVPGGHGVIVAVALSRRLVSLGRAVPRALATGASLDLSLRLSPGYDDASLAITEPSGEVKRIALGPGRAHEKRLRFDQAGAVTLEVLASGPEGVTVAALLVLAVGVAPVDRPPASGTEITEREPAAVEAALEALIAGERKRRGLPELSSHAALGAVARAHTEDMLAHHFVAHTSKSTGEAQDRVARAGLRTVVLLENIGRGYSAAEIHAGLMESPGHRANILHRDVRALGIGVGAEPEGERQAFVATQLFARFAEPTNLKSAAQDLFQTVRARRKQQGLVAVSLDDALSRTAQSAADTFAANPGVGEDATLARVSRGVRALPKGAAALSAALLQAEDLAQVAESEQLYTRELVSLGIGVAKLPEGSARQLAVVLLLALRR